MEVKMRKMVFLITLLLLFSGVVCAHRPIFVVDSDPVRLANPDISWAIYSDLEGGEVDYYQFQVSEQGLDFFTQLLVPTRKEYEDFRPTVALIGPGLPSAPDRKSTRLNSSHVRISYAVFCLKKKIY